MASGRAGNPARPSPLLLLLAAPLRGAHACEANESCGYPYNNQFTSRALNGPHSHHGRPCCPAMPGVFLVDTAAAGRNTVISPPGEGHCPGVPPDVVTVGAPLNPTARVYLANRQEGPADGALAWTDGGTVPRWGIGGCARPHPYYTKYALAYAADTDFTQGIPVLASSRGVPDAALLKAAEIIAEEARQVDARLAARGIRGARAALVAHRVRYAIFANAERRNDTCALCKALDPTWDCGAHIDSRGGRDTSLHPEVPHCQEGGKYPTTISEQYGIPYLGPDGLVPDSYCGSPTIAHEFFHTIQGLVIRALDPEGSVQIHAAAKRAVEEGIYVHHPGARDDGCDTDFNGCVTWEFHVKAWMTWHGVPAAPAEFRYQSRAEMKREAPWIAALVYRHAEDGDWNPCRGAPVDSPRDQTFPPHDTCAHAPGSALCAGPLSAAYIGPPMEQLLRQPEWAARARLA